MLPKIAKSQILQQYEKAQLRAVLLKAQMRSGEVAVEYAKCDSYAEIYPENYQVSSEIG